LPNKQKIEVVPHCATIEAKCLHQSLSLSNKILERHKRLNPAEPFTKIKIICCWHLLSEL